jgi:hypothetical protein
MNKEWLILVNGVEEGPFTIKELKRHPHVSPDTLVRKLEWKEWVAARQVSELKDLFKDETAPKLLNGKKTPADLSTDQAALTIDHQDPFHPYLWMLLILSIIIYLIYTLYK